MMPPIVTSIISIIALFISLASFGVALANFRRDRAQVRATCRFTEDHEGSDPHLLASVVNAGRRPIVLRLWGGCDKTGSWAGTVLGKDGGGHRLAEHERLDFTFTGQDVHFITPDNDDMEFVDLWFEDTLGRRHPMKGARAALRELLGDVPGKR